MSKMDRDRIEKIARDLARGDAPLQREIESKLAETDVSPEVAEGLTAAELDPATFAATRLITRGVDRDLSFSEERIIRGLPIGYRPIARIRNNRATTEFLGKALDYWVDEVRKSQAALNLAIPAVGRIEVTNGELPWEGTGWLVTDDIIITNRHVAERFAREGQTPGEFAFRAGARGGKMSSEIDFLEEEDRRDEAEHPVTAILWISPDKDPDVAFLRIRRAAGKPPLPKPIDLAEVMPDTDSNIAAIGYPAKDESLKDHDLALAYFGEVYEKKRLAVGKILRYDRTLLTHDCSTLGGNSGSALIDMATGKAVALHRGGFLDDSANTAVPAPYLRELLAKVQKRPSISVGETITPAGHVAGAVRVESQGPGVMNFKFNIPIEISVKVGVPVAAGTTASPLPTAVAPPDDTFESILAAAQQQFGSVDGVLRVREGFRFKNGWITDERVIVIEVKEKLSPAELAARAQKPFDNLFFGVGVDVRTAALPDQLQALGIDITVLERPSKPAKYKEPPGYDDPDSGMALVPIKDHMDAIFHVSPDSGFPNLKTFLGRIDKTLTATMYEWEEGNHISLAIADAMRPAANTLKMVTQRFGVGNGEATAAAVADMKKRIGKKFKHVWAATRGPSRLVQGFYHIKVASRDGEEVWLSSGNWKDSNQPDIDPAGEDSRDDRVLRGHNREWHAIIKHTGLATLFQKYIEYDFEQAKAQPTPAEEDEEGLAALAFFVPIDDERREARRAAKFFDPLVLHGELLNVQPLLTPDRDADGESLFIKEATAMVRGARKSVLLQNQSLGMSGDDNKEMTEFYQAVVDQQKAGRDVRIIIRDAIEFPGDGVVRQQALIERLKKFGFDTSTDGLRLQRRCHTKALIVDSKEVLFGSQNLTNGGALHNRDASLLVRSPDSVAKYFEEVFEYDWDNLTHNEADESVGGIRRAEPGEATPLGFRRVSLAELLGDD